MYVLEIEKETSSKECLLSHMPSLLVIDLLMSCCRMIVFQDKTMACI